MSNGLAWQADVIDALCHMVLKDPDNAALREQLLLDLDRLDGAGQGSRLTPIVHDLLATARQRSSMVQRILRTGAVHDALPDAVGDLRRSLEDLARATREAG